jgi:KaiC/GvpD/RAD55 family RecA-like ATPase
VAGLDLQRMGIAFLDREVGGIPRGSRTILIGPPGSGKTVFCMRRVLSCHGLNDRQGSRAEKM